jgi:hypothetical protein
MGKATKPRFTVSPTLVRSLREAEASSWAEGVDASGDLVYQDLKKQMLAGEIDADEAVELYKIAYGLPLSSSPKA